MKYLNKKDIFNFLKSHKIERNDLVLIHGNAVIFNNIHGKSKKKKISNFWKFIKEYFKDKGTVIVPSFSYCLTQNKVFDLKKTPGQVGFFGESFRKLKYTKRTNHPIFSVCFFGSKSKIILNTSNKTCFGVDSLFELLFKKHAKLLCIGCSYNELTYTHFIEQKANVVYRFNKVFKGFQIINGKKREVEVNYLVRDLHYPISTKLNLNKIINIMKKKGKYVYQNFGRFSSHSVQANSFFVEARKKIKKNKNYLIG